MEILNPDLCVSVYDPMVYDSIESINDSTIYDPVGNRRFVERLVEIDGPSTRPLAVGRFSFSTTIPAVAS